MGARPAEVRGTAGVPPTPSRRARVGSALPMTQPLGTWPPPASAPAHRREWPAGGGGIASVPGTAGGILGVASRRSHGPAHPDAWDPRVLDLVRFDEKHRGLKFDHPVFVDFLTPEEYSQRARSDA